MQSIFYLERFTHTYCPGRFAIKTIPPPEDAEQATRTKQAGEQADALIDYCVAIHEQGCKDLVQAFEMLVKAFKGGGELFDNKELRDNIFAQIKNACYPYIYISAADIRQTLTLTRKHPAPLVLAARDHISTIAEPNKLRSYYTEQCRNLLAQDYRLEVGLSIVPMATIYAIEGHIAPFEARKDTIELIQTLFPVPRLSDVEDTPAGGFGRWHEEVALRDDATLESYFWENYKQYLSSEKWSDELAFPAPGERAGLVRANLVLARKKAVETRGVVQCDESADSVVAPRNGVAHRPRPSNNRVPAAAKPARRPRKSLSYFDALRTHFSMSRLNHYTGTDAVFFQKNILTVNFVEYARKFVLRSLIEIWLAGATGENRLVVPSPRGPNPLGPSGRVFLFKDAIEFFKSLEAKDDDARRQKLKATAELIKEQKGAQQPKADDPRYAPYAECLKLVTELILSSDAPLPAYHYIPAHEVDDAAQKSAKDDKAYRKLLFESKPLPPISMINIGVGPSNAKTVTDHLAPLRPRCWILLGRCSGLRKQQHIGDYVFATSYVRRDGVLDRHVPGDVPIKTTRVLVKAFEEATDYLAVDDEERLAEIAREVASNKGKLGGWLRSKGSPTPEQEEARFHALREKVRLGPVISTSDRNWETAPTEGLLADFDTYRAVAIDMEAGALAANGYRFRVHFGAFLCVAAKPLDGSVRMRQLENKFFAQQSERHLDIAMGALRWLEYNPKSALSLQYSRELRGSDDPPWD